MAWSFVAHRGSGISTTLGTTVDVSFTGCTAGNVLVLYMSYDNTATSTGSPYVTSVSKPGGESASWHVAYSTRSYSVPAAGVTAMGFLYIIKPTSNWASQTITITLSESVVAKAAGITEFTGGSDVLRTDTYAYSRGSYYDSYSEGNLVQARATDLMLQMQTLETNAAGNFDISDADGGSWDTSNARWVYTTGGSANTNTAVGIIWKIVTADADLNMSPPTNPDGGWVFVALKLPPAGAGTGAIGLAGSAYGANVTFPAPANFHSTAQADTTIDLAWDSVTDVTHYRLERDGALLSNVITQTTFQDQGLNPGQTYSYRVRAVK